MRIVDDIKFWLSVARMNLPGLLIMALQCIGLVMIWIVVTIMLILSL